MSFGDDVTRFRQKALEQANEARQAISLELFSRVVQRTPVDTGRARGNWQASLDSPESAQIERLDKDGGGTINSIAGILFGSALANVLWLTNNLPYIQRLENGYSQQAPAGMVRTSVIDFENIVEDVGSTL